MSATHPRPFQRARVFVDIARISYSRRANNAGRQTFENGDGRPDVLIAQYNDALVALQNQSPNSWLSLRLIGSNAAAAIGARVTIDFDDGSSQASELGFASGYLSQSASEIYIGLNGPAPPAGRNPLAVGQ